MYNLYMNCIECKKIIIKSFSGFCSSKCYAKRYYRRDRIGRVCKECYKEFIGKYSSRYCSDSCRVMGARKVRSKYRNNPIKKETIEINCHECGAVFNNYDGVKYCSKRCRNRVKNRKKKDNIDKTGAVCAFCGFSDTRAIHAHHINRKDSLGIMFLCANHHYIFHSVVGYSNKSENNSKEEVLSTLNSATQIHNGI